MISAVFLPSARLLGSLDSWSRSQRYRAVLVCVLGLVVEGAVGVSPVEQVRNHTADQRYKNNKQNGNGRSV